ncbi:AAA family ATPase [Chryseobacterium indologenes]|uniref:McrB family protein n=1 Tax=Chryseobacterium indologenes TaxID=253 RepID=UPI0023E82A71|nr:AAA family ATPase [Chryseobacterium indologenes]WET51065.1 AAA family ATPase [Chryseobacterium indologenes]
MSYWHIQMNQPWGRNRGRIDSKLLLQEEYPVIGTGDWNDIQCRYFTNEDNDGIQKNDIILVREGSLPIALCLIDSDCFTDPALEQKYHHHYYRKVRVIDFFSEERKKLLQDCLQKYGTKYIQAVGTLTYCQNENATNSFIKEWHSLTIKEKKMNNYINLLTYKKQIILQGPPGTGKTRQAKVLAVQLLGLKEDKELKDNPQFKIIQFHPSYSYEDFVRGIVSKPNEDGDGILFKAENKILAEFAHTALQNYRASQNPADTIISEDIFDVFIEKIKDEMAENEHHQYPLTNSVYLFSADETKFKYKGDNWEAHKNGLNMKFSELRLIVESEVQERQDIKKMSEVEEKTRQHATYFMKVVEKYYEFKENYQPERIQTEEILLKNYVLVIDEINRANLSSVLGELIYALEYRGKAVESIYAIEDATNEVKNKLILPPNLYIIGTMNTADRSVGHIDYAIRRRFAFIDVLPESLEDDDRIHFNTEGFKKVSDLFKNSNVSGEFEAKDVQLGHSYFIAKNEDIRADQTKEEIFRMKMNYEVVPILLEYVKDGVLIGSYDGKDIKEYINDLKINN